MMQKLFYKSIFTLGVLCFSAAAVIQGQIYPLEKAAVAGGGISDAAGGSFTLSATTGQTVAGNALRGDAFTMPVGFWTYSPLAPTSAGASIAGRVLTANGQGVRNARLVLINSAGAGRFAQTGSFGYFRFENVPVGETYILSVESKRFSFAEPTRIIALSADLRDVNFISEPE